MNARTFHSYAGAYRVNAVIVTFNGNFCAFTRFADNFFFSHMVGRTIESMVCLMIYLCGGVFEKHPNLKIICLETGASQMPWWLSRMDEHWEKLPHLVPWQKRKPSDIFNESVYVGCEPFEDGLFEWAVEYLGGDRLVLATDSPSGGMAGRLSVM